MRNLEYFSSSDRSTEILSGRENRSGQVRILKKRSPQNTSECLLPLSWRSSITPVVDDNSMPDDIPETRWNRKRMNSLEKK